MGNMCSVAKSWRNCKLANVFPDTCVFQSSTYMFTLYLSFLNLNQFPVLLVLDKRELKEWKKMVEKQLAEKVKEPCDAKFN